MRWFGPLKAYLSNPDELVHALDLEDDLDERVHDIQGSAVSAVTIHSTPAMF